MNSPDPDAQGLGAGLPFATKFRSDLGQVICLCWALLPSLTKQGACIK